MIELTNDNYFTPEAMRGYWSVSQFKAFARCEAAGLAELHGHYKREETASLLVGSYVDAYFAGELEQFKAKNPKIFNSRTGELKADYKKADELIARIGEDDTMLKFLTGEKQRIMTAKLFSVPWKIKIDVHGGNFIADLKVVKDFEPIYEEGFGRRPWIAYWGYDIQGAVYQRVEQIASGRTHPLPFYIVAITKEKVPDVAVIQLPQSVLDTALKIVDAKIERFNLIKRGEVDPIRCGKCDWCKSTKQITEPEIYEGEG